MKWSIMKSKMFSRCQRKWYYYDFIAHPRANDGTRREAYFLKQLQSVAAWKGSLVDTVIHNTITSKIISHVLPEEREVLDYASKLMNAQFLFAKEERYKCSNVTKANAGDSFCALYDLEYNGQLTEESLKNAKKDVNCALRNLLSSELFSEIVQNNLYAVSQRTLTFSFLEDVRVICVPDMIVFFEHKSPLIIDWKVHRKGNTDAWLQLGVYATALSKVSPHKDFPSNFQKQMEDLSDVRLVEFQLLKNKQRQYSVSDEDILDVEDYIFRSSTQMKRLINRTRPEHLNERQFQTARSPAVCEWCQFKKLCWKVSPVKQLLLEAF